MTEEKWKKGDFLINPKTFDAWGIGIIIEDERTENIKVFFEHPACVKTIQKAYLERIDDPGASKVFLEHALVDEYSAGDRQPFPSVLKNFLEDFPCGFRGQLLLRAERDYKI